MKNIFALFLLFITCYVYGQAPYDGASLKQTFMNISIGVFAPGGTADYNGVVGVTGSSGYDIDDVVAGDILVDENHRRYKVDNIVILAPGVTAILDLECLEVSCVAPTSGKGNITKPTTNMGLELITEPGSSLITFNQLIRSLNHSLLVIDSLYEIGGGGASNGDVTVVSGVGYRHTDGINVDTINLRTSNLPLSSAIQITGEVASNTNAQAALQYLVTYLNGRQLKRFSAGNNVRVYGYGAITATKSVGVVTINVPKDAELISAQFLGSSGDLSSGELTINVDYASDYNYNNSDADTWYPVVTIQNRNVVLPTDPYLQRPDDTDDSINVFHLRFVSENRSAFKITGLSGDFGVLMQF